MKDEHELAGHLSKMEIIGIEMRERKKWTSWVLTTLSRISAEKREERETG